MRRPRFRLLVLFFCALSASALAQPALKRSVLVAPFENASKVPGIEWIGEAFPEVLGLRLTVPDLYLIRREERAYGFDRLGIPLTLRPSRATLYALAEQIGVDFLILGRYSFDGQSFTAVAQVLDMHRLHSLGEVHASGTLPALMDIQNGLAWDVLRIIDGERAPSRNTFLAASPSVRLDAFENYIRGVTSSSRQEKVRRLREAIRIKPDYTDAIFQLGKAYFEAGDFPDAVIWLSKVPKDNELGREAVFYVGLAAYHQGDYGRAEEAFAFLSARLPLTEIYNDLGVVEARRAKVTAAQYFQKAVDADPNDPDYRYNYAVALYRGGDLGGALRQAREALVLRPSDVEAKALSEWISAGVAYASLPAAKAPLERIKRNYDETSFRQLAMELQNVTERRLALTDPATHARYYLEHGRELMNKNLLVEAEQDFREAVSLQPNSAPAHLGLATVLEREGQLQDARPEILKAVSLEPTADAYLALARIDLDAGDMEAASGDLDRVLRLEPASPAALELQHEIAAHKKGPGADASPPKPGVVKQP